MFPTPKGYISILDAVDRVSRALHGEPKTIPWRGKDLDEAVLRSGREQTTEAQEWLIAELSAGRLVVEIDNIEVPTEYWTCYGAHTTVHTGCLQPPEMDAGDYAKLAYRPCFIERRVFEKRLSTIGGGSITARRDPAVSLISAETQCRRWLIEELKAPRTKTKVDWQGEVLDEEKFPGLSGRAFLRAWANAMKEPTTHHSWHKPGPVGSSERVV